MDDYEDDMRSLWKKSGERTKPGLMGLFKYPTSLSLPQSPAFSEHSEKEGYEASVFGKSGKCTVCLSSWGDFFCLFYSRYI